MADLGDGFLAELREQRAEIRDLQRQLDRAMTIGSRVQFDSEPDQHGTVVDIGYVIKWDDEEWGTEFQCAFALRPFEQRKEE